MMFPQVICNILHIRNKATNNFVAYLPLKGCIPYVDLKGCILFLKGILVHLERIPCKHVLVGPILAFCGHSVLGEGQPTQNLNRPSTDLPR